MALKIRLRRMGRRKAPTYRIVVAESSMPRDGRFVTSLGYYNPRTEPLTLVVDREAARSWIGKGAKPTETVHSLLRRAGVYRDEPPASETVVETVKATAKKAVSAVAAAAEAVADAVADVAEEVREAVTGADEEPKAADEESKAPEEAADGRSAEPSAREGE